MPPDTAQPRDAESMGSGGESKNWGSVCDGLRGWHGRHREGCAAPVPDVSQLSARPEWAKRHQKPRGSLRQGGTSCSPRSVSIPQQLIQASLMSLLRHPQLQKKTLKQNGEHLGADRDLTLSICWLGAGTRSPLRRQGSLQELPKLREDRPRQMYAPSLPWRSSRKECSNSSKLMLQLDLFIIL